MPDASGFKVSDVPPPAEDDGDKKAPPQRDRIVAAVLKAGVTFWSDAEGEGYATYPHDGLIERHAIRSRRFRLIVRGIFGADGGRVLEGQRVPASISDTAMRETIPIFEAMALDSKIGRDVDVRLTQSDGAVWLDLGDDAWRLVRITADGWAVINSATVPLIRPDGMRARCLSRSEATMR